MTTEKEFSPTAVFEFDYTKSSNTRYSFKNETQAQILIRYQQTPLGLLKLEISDGYLESAAIKKAIDSDLDLSEKIKKMEKKKQLLKTKTSIKKELKSWSLIICTRNRTNLLKDCLDSLLQINGIETGEVIVVDNAPDDQTTEELVQKYPFRYLKVSRPGLNWARDAGARAASGEILIYTDDDTRIDSFWLHAMLKEFESPRVGCVTGLTLAAELKTEAQHLFQRYGGHNRGFERIIFDRNSLTPAAAGRVGSGANMAFRRELVVGMQLFHVELDAGTATLSGGDTYAYYKILQAGYQICYTPEALIWHKDRSDLASLEFMLYGYSVGVFSFLTRILISDRESDALLVGFAWLRHHHMKESLKSLMQRPNKLPLKLLWAEWKGVFVGLWTYFKTQRKVAVEKEAVL